MLTARAGKLRIARATLSFTNHAATPARENPSTDHHQEEEEEEEEKKGEGEQGGGGREEAGGRREEEEGEEKGEGEGRRWEEGGGGSCRGRIAMVVTPGFSIVPHRDLESEGDPRILNSTPRT